MVETGNPPLSPGEKAMLAAATIEAIAANTTMTVSDAMDGLLLAAQAGRLRVLYSRDDACLIFDYDEMLCRVPRFVLRQGSAEEN